MLNSTIVAAATTVGAVGFGVMAGYVLARYQFRGRGALYALFAAGLMFPNYCRHNRALRRGAVITVM